MSSEHTSVPAATSTSPLGPDLVSTWTGSRSGTESTVYCHVPAHSGGVITPPGSMSVCLRTTAITCSVLGRPAQSTAVYSGHGTAVTGVADGVARGVNPGGVPIV